MQLLATIGILSVIVFCGEAVPQCHLSELGVCLDIAINYLHTLPRRSLPETNDDVEVLCKEVNKAVECVSGFGSNCTTPLERELFGLILEGAEHLVKDFCTSGSDSRAKYLAHSACLNKVAQMDAVKEQIEYALATVEKLNEGHRSDGLTYICCGYSKVLSNIASLGREHCGDEAVKTAGELLSIAVAELPDVLCSGFTGEEDRCKALLPPVGSKPSDAVKDIGIYKAIENVLKNWLD